MNERNLLFVKYDLRGTIDNINEKISSEINGYDSDYILSVKPDEICDHLVDKHTFITPQIFPDHITFRGQVLNIELFRKISVTVQETQNY